MSIRVLTDSKISRIVVYVIFIAVKSTTAVVRVKNKTSRLECALGHEKGRNGYEFEFGHVDGCVYFSLWALQQPKRSSEITQTV